MNPDNLEDPIRVILKSIVDITFGLVRSLREEGRKAEAQQLILWVAECLHGILVRKLKFYQIRPFTPALVRARYNAKRDKAGTKIERKRKFERN